MPGNETNPGSIVFIVVLLAGLAWFGWIVVRVVWNVYTKPDEPAAAQPVPRRDPLAHIPADTRAEPDPEVTVDQVALDDQVTIDLRHLPSTRMVIRGAPNWIDHSHRGAFDSTHYALIREPGNRHDANAVAVRHPSGRKVGYISRTRAQSMASHLDQMGAAAFIVSGGMEDGRLRVDLPLLPGLRSFVKSGPYAS